MSSQTGIAVPLGALLTKNSPVIGEFPSLKILIPFCRKSGLQIIQLLPVNDTGMQSSPYSGLSAFALHPIYISLSALPEFTGTYQTNKKFRENYDSFIAENSGTERYRYQNILKEKTVLLQMLYEKAAIPDTQKKISAWTAANPWIVEYAVYKALKTDYLEASWKSWAEKDKNLSKEQIEKRWNKETDRKKHLFYAWMQMRAHEQLAESAAAARQNGIIIKGDIPIMMNEDSCDVWASPGLFDETQKAGSPPDGENRLGQSWGFPIYNWKNMAADNYAWWKSRLKSASEYYDAYRLDHILGFFRIWAIPYQDTTAYLGHPDPYVPFSREELHTAGFDDGRIRWLSQPHIPTSVVEDITWNHEAAHAILSMLADRLGSEELWILKKELKGDQQIFATDFGTVCTADAAARIKQKLSEYWRNRCIIEVERNKYVPVWSYSESTSWQSLSFSEKEKLKALFSEKNEAQEKEWEKHARKILPALTQSTPMIPCGEDLGVTLKSVSEVLAETGILGLRVIRWHRRWNENGQPFVPLKEYPRLSVVTTSVHDSPTLRQWWSTDRNAAALFVKSFPEYFNHPDEEKKSFSQQTAQSLLTAAAAATSCWCIHPLQDFLYLSDTYILPDPLKEQINIPGTVSSFNWTYKLPVCVETLSADTELQNKIKEIVEKHREVQ